MLRIEWVEDAESEDENGWYVVRGGDRVAGPFDDDGEASWWLEKYLEA